MGQYQHFVQRINILKCSNYCSVPDINASDLPGSVKHTLKSLAHDLAGSLVFDYGECTSPDPIPSTVGSNDFHFVPCEIGLDVSTSVHALGKTSSILGHNILVGVDNHQYL